MVNYNNGKIYKIEPLNGEEGDIYIGSTTKNLLSQRLDTHRSDYKCFLNGKKKVTTSCNLFIKYGVENCKIILLELVNVNTKDELLTREAHFIKTLKCVNKYIPLRTHDKNYMNEYKREYYKEYYEDNKNKLKQDSHEYYEDNKDKIKQCSKEYRKNNNELLKKKDKIYYENKKIKEGYKDKIKEYQQQNKDKIKEHKIEYYQKNKDKIKEKRRERYKLKKETLIIN